MLLSVIVGFVAGGGMCGDHRSRKRKNKKFRIDLNLLIDKRSTYAHSCFLFLTPEEFVRVAMTNKKSWSKWEDIIQSILEGNGAAEVEYFQDKEVFHNEILRNFLHKTDFKLFITKIYENGVPEEVCQFADKVSPKVIDYERQLAIFIPRESFVTPAFYSKKFTKKIFSYLTSDCAANSDLRVEWIGSDCAAKQVMCTYDPKTKGLYRRKNIGSIYLSNNEELMYVVEMRMNPNIYQHDSVDFTCMTSESYKTLGCTMSLPFWPFLNKGNTFVVFYEKIRSFYNRVYFAENGEVQEHEYKYPDSTDSGDVQRSVKKLEKLFKNGSVSKEEISKWQKKFKTKKIVR